MDPESSRDSSHRRTSIVSRIKQLDDVLAIDVAAYAIMSNRTYSWMPPSSRTGNAVNGKANE